MAYLSINIDTNDISSELIEGQTFAELLGDAYHNDDATLLAWACRVAEHENTANREAIKALAIAFNLIESEG